MNNWESDHVLACKHLTKWRMMMSSSVQPQIDIRTSSWCSSVGDGHHLCWTDLMLSFNLLVNSGLALPQYVWAALCSAASRGLRSDVSKFSPNWYCKGKNMERWSNIVVPQCTVVNPWKSVLPIFFNTIFFFFYNTMCPGSWSVFSVPWLRYRNRSASQIYWNLPLWFIL